MKRKSSFRRTAAPIPVALMAVFSRKALQRLLGGLARRATFGHVLCARGDGFHDVVVAGAAADISVKLIADGVLVEVVTAPAYDVERRHDHAGRAVAALEPVMLAERLLHRMQGAIRLRETFDGGDVGA